MSEFVDGIEEKDVFWMEGEKNDQIRINYDVIVQKPTNFNNNLRLISVNKITPEIIEKMEAGAPYNKIGTTDDEKYKQIIAGSITENLCDKFASPNFIHNFETQYLPYPFPEEKAKPLSQSKAENEVLDNPKYIV